MGLLRLHMKFERVLHIEYTCTSTSGVKLLIYGLFVLAIQVQPLQKSTLQIAEMPLPITFAARDISIYVANVMTSLIVMFMRKKICYLL